MAKNYQQSHHEEQSNPLKVCFEEDAETNSNWTGIRVFSCDGFQKLCEKLTIIEEKTGRE